MEDGVTTQDTTMDSGFGRLQTILTQHEVRIRGAVLMLLVFLGMFGIFFPDLASTAPVLGLHPKLLWLALFVSGGLLGMMELLSDQPLYDMERYVPGSDIQIGFESIRFLLQILFVGAVALLVPVSVFFDWKATTLSSMTVPLALIMTANLRLHELLKIVSEESMTPWRTFDDRRTWLLKGSFFAIVACCAALEVLFELGGNAVLAPAVENGGWLLKMFGLFLVLGAGTIIAYQDLSCVFRNAEIWSKGAEALEDNPLRLCAIVAGPIVLLLWANLLEQMEQPVANTQRLGVLLSMLYVMYLSFISVSRARGAVDGMVRDNR